MLGDVDQHQADQDLVGVEAVAQQRDDRRPGHAAEHAGRAGSATHDPARRVLGVGLQRDAAGADRAERRTGPSAPMFQTLARKHTARPEAR